MIDSEIELERVGLEVRDFNVSLKICNLLNKCVSLVLFFSTFLDYILCKCNFNYIFLLFFYFAVDLKKADEQGPADPRQGEDRVKCKMFCFLCGFSVA